MKFVFASNNPNKLIEVRDILMPLGITVLSQKEAGIAVNPEETGTTFEENSLIKARAACAASGLPSLADDSGLAVKALNGAPGVYSARYGGDNCTDEGRYSLLLKNMAGIEDRKAAFISCCSCVFPNGDELTAQGSCEGYILQAPEGTKGFGYDPVFFSEDLQKPFGTASSEEKNSVSHRSRAMNALAEKIKCYFESKDGKQND